VRYFCSKIYGNLDWEFLPGQRWVAADSFSDWAPPWDLSWLSWNFWNSWLYSGPGRTFKGQTNPFPHHFANTDPQTLKNTPKEPSPPKKSPQHAILESHHTIMWFHLLCGYNHFHFYQHKYIVCYTNGHVLMNTLCHPFLSPFPSPQSYPTEWMHPNMKQIVDSFTSSFIYMSFVLHILFIMYHPICMGEERRKKSLEISRGNIHAICDHLLIEMSHFNEYMGWITMVLYWGCPSQHVWMLFFCSFVVWCFYIGLDGVLY